jgi:hypothetical protein
MFARTLATAPDGARSSWFVGRKRAGGADVGVAACSTTTGRQTASNSDA